MQGAGVVPRWFLKSQTLELAKDTDQKTVTILI